MQFIKTTIIGGVVFLVPVGIIVLVIVQVGEVMLIVAEPMADLVEVESIGGIAVANLIAAVILIAICFLAGLLARTGPAKRMVRSLETKVLQGIPGYSLLKGFTNSFSQDKTAQMKPVLVSRGYTSRIGLEVERTADDRVVVYFPGSPNAWSGVIEIVAAERVEHLEGSIGSVFAHAEGLGRGTGALFGN